MNKDVKTVVITGSSRGFGFCQAKKFKELGFNVVLSATNESNLLKALEELNTINPDETNAVSVVEKDLISSIQVSIRLLLRYK